MSSNIPSETSVGTSVSSLLECCRIGYRFDGCNRLSDAAKMYYNKQASRVEKVEEKGRERYVEERRQAGGMGDL